MARFIECDVCDAKMDLDAPDVAQMSIPAAWLGDLGDERLLVDLCSWACVQRINPSAAQMGEPVNVTNPYVDTAAPDAQIGEPSESVGNVRVQQPTFVPLTEEQSSAATGVKRRR